VTGIVTNDEGRILLVRVPPGFAPDEARTLVTHPAGAERLADALSGRDGVVNRTYRLDPYEALAERAL
jgi:hypothetical protein